MANSPTAKKRARQAERNRTRNAGMRSRVRTAMKKVVSAIEAGDKASATELLKAASPVIDSMVNKGILHKNKAARHKSRLNAKIKALS